MIRNKLASKFGANAVLQDPKIPYRETIRKTVKVQGRHKKQTGGHGQFGDVWIEFSPITDSDTDFEFVDAVVGGVVPRNFIPSVEKGLRENLVKGVLAGYPDGAHPGQAVRRILSPGGLLRNGLQDRGPHRL